MLLSGTESPLSSIWFNDNRELTLDVSHKGSAVLSILKILLEIVFGLLCTFLKNLDNNAKKSVEKSVGEVDEWHSNGK